MQRDDSIHERLADRLANILTKLNMGYQLNIKELAEEFGVSTRTISRDFDRLNAYLPLLQDDENKKFYLDSNYLGKIAPKDIRNFAQLSGISHLYPSLDMSFLRELLDTRAQQIYSAKGYSFEDVSQFKELFKQIKLSSEDLTKTVGNIFNDLSQNLDALSYLKPTLENLANGIVLQKETLERMESNNFQSHRPKNNNRNCKYL